MVAPYLNYDAAMADLAERRRQFDEYTMRKYREVEAPESYGRLSGWMPEDYRGPYAGMATFGALSGAAGMFGEVGSNLDPRFAELGYTAGQKTLGGRELDLRADVARRDEKELDRRFDAGRSDADREYFENRRRFDHTFGEDQRRSIQAQTNTDAQLAMEMGVDPAHVVSGSILPEYLRPHAEWARQHARANQGTIPTHDDLVNALGRHGHRPEDFNQAAPGQPFPGTFPTSAPGVIYDPARGGHFDTISGKALTGPEVGDVARNRMAGGVKVAGFNQDGTPIYAAPQGTQIASQAGLGPQAGPAGADFDGAPMMNNSRAAGTPAGGLRDGGTGRAGAATRQAMASGTPRSQAQRELEERGRQFDIGSQIERDLADAKIAREQGQEARADELERRAMGLREEIERGQLGLDTELGRGRLGLDTDRLSEERRQFDSRLGFDKGREVGMIDGQETLDRGALLGTFNGMSTLEGQKAYGGSGLVGGGLTLDAQRAIGRVGGQETLDAQALRGYTPQGATLAREGQEADTALRALQLESTLRTDPFKLEQYRRGLSASGVPNIVEAVAGRQQLPGTAGPTFGRAPMATMGGAVQAVTGGPTFGRPGVQAQPMAGQPAGAAPTPMAPRPAMPTFGAQPASVEDQARALGPLNKINAREYLKADAGGKRYVRSLYKGIGEAQEDEDVEEAARRALPGFARGRSMPSFGRIAA